MIINYKSMICLDIKKCIFMYIFLGIHCWLGMPFSRYIMCIVFIFFAENIRFISCLKFNDLKCKFIE